MAQMQFYIQGPSTMIIVTVTTDATKRDTLRRLAPKIAETVGFPLRAPVTPEGLAEVRKMPRDFGLRHLKDFNDVPDAELPLV